jgi:hypothetical protein
VDYIVEGDFSTHVQLGSSLPSFTIRFRDRNGDPASPRENYEVDVQAEGLNRCFYGVSNMESDEAFNFDYVPEFTVVSPSFSLTWAMLCSRLSDFSGPIGVR